MNADNSIQHSVAFLSVQGLDPGKLDCNQILGGWNPAKRIRILFDLTRGWCFFHVSIQWQEI